MNNTAPVRLTPPLCLLAVTLSLAGCGHKDTIVGKWQGTASQQGSTENTTIQFTPDGKETINLQMSRGPVSVAMGGSGTYTVSGSTLTQTMTTMTVGNMTMPIPANQSAAQPNPFTLDGDHLTLTNPTTKQSVTLTRVKE